MAESGFRLIIHFIKSSRIAGIEFKDEAEDKGEDLGMKPMEGLEYLGFYNVLKQLLRLKVLCIWGTSLSR